MLTQIYVKDFILLDEVNLSLKNGMSAFTGETGAGKSLLMDAIGVLKGDRVNASMIKQGKDKAIIEGVFSIPKNHMAYSMFEEAGYDLEENEIIITREINKEGKSTTRINQRVATVSFLKEVMATLIDLHSQHDTHYLLNPKSHITLLDHFLSEDALKLKVKESYHEFKKYDQAYTSLLQSDYSEEDLEYLTFQLNEIDDASITVDELSSLEEEIKKMNAFEKVSSNIYQAISLLNQDDGILSKIFEANHHLSNIEFDDELNQYASQLNDTYYTLDDLTSNLKAYVDSLEFDEHRFHEVQDRISFIHKMYRKHGGSYEQMLNKRNDLEKTIDSILHRQDSLQKLIKLKEESYKAYQKVAMKLHTIRVKKAKELESLVISQLKDLALPHAKFKISIQETAPSSTGIDQVEFLISMNAGEPLKSLSATASGGELSRFMLGMKSVFTHLQGIETIIFDEIDTGVSGTVAFSIGKKMQELSAQVQVFCVTHLAPVAACAHQHYEVKKTQEKNKVTTQLKLLNNEERIEELAMISSGTISDSAKLMAKELLDKAQ